MTRRKLLCLILCAAGIKTQPFAFWQVNQIANAQLAIYKIDEDLKNCFYDAKIDQSLSSLFFCRTIFVLVLLI